ncbi:Cytidine deaminase [Frankia canadensis]|uniref:Cytidine deaminase n=1 Tax=Frankia canadensis TaxID=1836972 RepID=A0A2I2KMM4_9ACTN|nr:cytidine deaminase [Frankia canadensis]SNQ46906.1 Cytidine deaminase [Frankia canadensis]SOU54196.1 Cytidine deaminase [Frankia canadensis]
MTADPTSPGAVPAGGPGLELAAEDAKLLVLARSARLRAYVPDGRRAEGAALRDTDGRTYAAATVGLPRAELAISALRAAVAAAVSSGARRFEAAAVVTEGDGIDADDLATLAEFGTGIPVLLAGTDGTARARTAS